MSKLSACVLCIGAALIIGGSASANGGTYHHAEFVPLNSMAAAPQPQYGCPNVTYKSTDCLGSLIPDSVHRLSDR